MKSWYSICAKGAGAEVVIYDEIGAFGISAKGFLAELSALPEASPLDLRLNSPGGSVFDAVAIHNALQRHAGKVTVWIDGVAASAASYVAMAGDEIVMPENAFMMIHDPEGIVSGRADDMRAMAEALDKIKTSLLRGYAAKSGKSDDEIAALMAAETWVDAKTALELGLATKVSEPVRMAARFEVAQFRNAPPVLVETLLGEQGDEAGSDQGELASDAPLPDDGPEAKTAQQGDQGADALGAKPPPVDVPAQPPAVTPAPDTSAPPVPDAATIRAAAIAHARMIVDLCRLGGQPQMAAQFLEQDASLDAVRASLLAVKASADPDVTSLHAQPGPPSAARPWAEIVARTFKLKG
jgi:ATP-dependent protease ClpP protease subunit